MDESALQLVYEIGTRLGQQTRPSKDSIVKSLRTAATALAKLEQPPAPDVAVKLGAAERLENSVKPLRRSIINRLLQHRDKDVRLLLAVCVSEIFRIMAPEPPFEDKYLREIFKLILSTFAELADTTSPFFSWRVKILETVSRCKCCVIMLDVDCSDMVLEMFNTFFAAVRDHHQLNIIQDILSIMVHILYEEASQPLLDVILHNLLKDKEGVPAAASGLAVSVIESCADKLEPFVCGFLTSCILDRDAVGSELKEFYHEIIFKIFQCAPQILLAVIPNLSQELLTDQVDVRIKAVSIVGKLLAVPEQNVAEKYYDLFSEFLKRFSDKSPEVRMSSLQCAEGCYSANPTGKAAREVLMALEGRLLDFDDRVRTKAVIVACDLAKSNLKFVSPTLIAQATERLRDKRISVRRKAIEKLLEVYRAYCEKCSEGHFSISNDFELIPCKILMLCYDKDCKEFRSQSMELILVDELFPALLLVEERTKHWIHLFSLFTPFHVKALSSILSQKHRLQNEMQSYLALRTKEKGNHSEDVEDRYRTSFVKMAAFFPHHIRAEECFHKLNQMRDNNIFNLLAQLLHELTTVEARTTRDKLLHLIGERHPQFEFLRVLSAKCSYNIFSLEYIRCILDCIFSYRFGGDDLEASSVKLLLAIISTFPSLLRGSEKQFLTLLESNPVDDKLIEALAKAGPCISVQLRDIYPFLKRLCLEGTRAQSKRAVSAIAALVSASEQVIFSKLCKELVDSLHRGDNIPTVLQSLGCIAQYSASIFESKYGEISAYLYEKVFQVGSPDDLNTMDDPSLCGNSCKLKIYGLKTLVKSFLPHQGIHVNKKIDELLDILLLIMKHGEIYSGTISCENDKSHIKLAAAKSVLRLSRRWDLYISPEIYCFTILMAKDSPSFMRREFIDKIHKLLKDHAIPNRYACAFALSISDCSKDLQEDSVRYLAEFIKEYSGEAQIRQTSAVQGGSIILYPAYVVVFLIYFLAHDTGFPLVGCQDEESYARFCSPLLFMLQALVNGSTMDGNMDVINDAALYLFSIFRAIKKADDAFDVKITPKLHILADIGFSFISASNPTLSSSRAPGQILLPSSLYRANSTYLTQSSLDECFIKSVIKIFQAQSFLPGGTFPKRGRRCQESISQPDVNNCSLTLSFCKQVDSFSTGAIEIQKNVKQDVAVGCRRKRAVSPSNSGLVDMQECSIISQQNCALETLEPTLEILQLSSCDSEISKSSQAESHVLARRVEANGTSECKNVRKKRGFKAKHKEFCSMEEKSNEGEALVGQRIKLFSTVDGCFNSCTVDFYNSESKTHQITYDSGEVELLCLENKSWETVTDGSQVER